MPKQQSEGWRPFVCNLAQGIVENIGRLTQVAHNVPEFLADLDTFLKHPTDPAHFLRNGYETLRQNLDDEQALRRTGMKALATRLNMNERELAASLEYGVQLAAAGLEIAGTVVEVGVYLVVSASPLGPLVDVASLALGYDVLTGEELDGFMWGALIGGLIAGGVLGGMSRAGARASRMSGSILDAGRGLAQYGDDLARSGARGMGVMDDIAASGSRLRRSGRELLENGRDLFRRGRGVLPRGRLDGGAAAARLQSGLDEVVSSKTAVRRTGGATKMAGHTQRAPVWDSRVQRWRDPQTGRFTKSAGDGPLLLPPGKPTSLANQPTRLLSDGSRIKLYHGDNSPYIRGAV